MTRDEVVEALVSTRLELREAQRQLGLHRDARRVTARALEQANDDADKAWREVERLREQLGMDCCEGGVAV